MQIKKFEAVDMPSAIQMIKSELGSDAVILSTRHVRKGKGAFGIFGRPMVEVTAAVDVDSKEQSAGNTQRKNTSSSVQGGHAESLPHWIHPLKNEIQEIRDEMKSLYYSTSETPEVQRLLDEFSTFKEMVQGSIVPPSHKYQSMPEPLQFMVRQLAKNDVDPRIAEKMMTGILQRLPKNAYATDAQAGRTLRRILRNIIRVQGGIRLGGEKPKKVALIGPTGVGKTTTIAKIAADFTLARKKKVALITVDTYRIAAIEQLKIYAKIIGIPVDVVLHEEDLDNSFRRHQDKDLILIDTAGRSHKNTVQIKELQRMFAGRQDIEKHLVVSTTTKQSDMTSILNHFKALDFHYLLFTKMDEGSKYGTILNAVLESGMLVSYLTNGQRVPEDIRQARVEYLQELILSSNGSERMYHKLS